MPNPAIWLFLFGIFVIGFALGWISRSERVKGSGKRWVSKPDKRGKQFVTRLPRVATERVKPPHKCRRIASAVMDVDRDWWIGELLEPVPEWPKETHCLHMKTPIKNVVFLCNGGDFEQLLVLSNVVVELQNLDWLNSMTEGAKSRSQANGKSNE